MKLKVGMLSLGCARNLVDAEIILGYLKAAGFKIVDEIVGADVAMVNTCCFIREAQEESIDTILELCQLKSEGRIKKILVCGCLVQRHKQELLKELKEVDAFLDVGSIDKVVSVVDRLTKGEQGFGQFGPPEFLYTHSQTREFLTPRHFAYIKISEGCNNHCSYCIIPRLRGRYRSRPMPSILKEADTLFRSRKVKEINLIGQDTTMYGQDLYGKTRIDQLLKKLSAKAQSKWIRLLYTHPAHFSKELIKVMKSERGICKYIDLPIQHINDRILKQMNRGTSRDEILSLIETLRKEIPNLCIRTTVIVGFPGETERQFAELLDFIRDVRFERLGLFRYSREDDTAAFNFGPQIPQKIKQERFNQILSLQQDISRKINQGFLGEKLRVLIDEQESLDRHQYIGRTQYDAPEVDGCVYVESKRDLKIGDFVNVEITDTLEYDLVGRAIGELKVSL